MPDLTACSNMLKETWPFPMDTAYSTEQLALQEVESTTEGVTNDATGRYAIVPIRTGRNQGMGAIAEREPRPQPGQRVRKISRVNLAWLYGGTDFSQQVMELADSDPRSFINIVDEEMSGLKEDLQWDFSRIIYNDRWGAVARLNDPGSTQTINANGSDSQVTFTMANGDYTYYLEVGMKLDVILVESPTADSAAGSTACSKLNGNEPVVVKSVDSQGDSTALVTFTWTGAANLTLTAAADDTWLFVRHKSFHAETDLDNSYSKEPAGLRMIASQAPLQGVTAASDLTSWFGAQTADFSATSGVYSESRVLRALDDTRIKSGEYPKLFFTDMGGRRAIWNFFSQPQGGLSASGDSSVRRFTNTIEYMQGISAIPFNYNGVTIRIVEDPRFPAQQYTDNQNTFLLGICSDKIKQFRATEGWQFVEDGKGNNFLLASDRSHVYEVGMYNYVNFGVTKRNCHLQITGLKPLI